MKKFVIDINLVQNYIKDNNMTLEELQNILNSKLDHIKQITLINDYSQLDEIIKL